MSDHDAAPDPMDKAYAQAEAVLSDDSARAARRARVLAAVGREPATPAASSPPIRRPAWRYGGWLAAASVAAVSLFVATQIDPPTPFDKPPVPTTPAVPAAAAPDVATVPAPAARAPAQTPKPEPPAVAVAPVAAAPLTSDVAPVVAPPPPVQIAEARATPPAAPPPATPERSSSQSVDEIVVTSGRRAEARAERPAAVFSLGSPGERAERLRDAAAAGRTAEIAALLAKGVPVDAPDDEGETALMKSIQANHPAAAALLRRRGASLDGKNLAGESARDMAMSIGDAELNRALGLDR